MLTLADRVPTSNASTTLPDAMTPERAKKVLERWNLDDDYRKFMTEGEIEHILKIWERQVAARHSMRC